MSFLICYYTRSIESQHNCSKSSERLHWVVVCHADWVRIALAYVCVYHQRMSVYIIQRMSVYIISVCLCISSAYVCVYHPSFYPFRVCCLNIISQCVEGIVRHPFMHLIIHQIKPCLSTGQSCLEYFLMFMFK